MADTEKRGMPSMLALLGLLAVAGYQNRDKISQVLQGLGGAGNAGGAQAGQPQQGGGLLQELGSLFGGGQAQGAQSASGNTVSGGLNDIINTFKNAGQTEAADSWVTPGVPTQGLSPSQVESAIGQDNLNELAKRTGLTYDEIVRRLSTSIPETVDRLTPDGHFPQSEEEARQLLMKT